MYIQRNKWDMKIKQSVSENCWIESSLNSTEKKVQSIFLILSVGATDKEKVESLGRVTNILIKKDWVVGESQQLSNAIALEYVLECDVNNLVEDMLSCAPLKS